MRCSALAFGSPPARTSGVLGRLSLVNQLVRIRLAYGLAYYRRMFTQAARIVVFWLLVVAWYLVTIPPRIWRETQLKEEALRLISGAP